MKLSPDRQTKALRYEKLIHDSMDVDEDGG